MGKHGLLFFAIVFASYFGHSQGRFLTMEDVVLGPATHLAPRDLPGLQWIKGTANWSFSDSAGTHVIKGALRGQPSALFSLADLNAALRHAGADTLGTLPEFNWIKNGSITFVNRKGLYRYLVREQTAELIQQNAMDSAAAHEDMHEGTRRIAYTVENNLFIQAEGRQIHVTRDDDPGIVNGQLVHRQEFGITKGTFWSPSGNKLAFYRKDETMVTDYPVPGYEVRPAASNHIKYPMAGDVSEEVTIGVFDLMTGKTVFLQTGEPRDQYLTNIAWSPDEKSIYVAVLNRGQDHLKLKRYDAATGDWEKTLFEEKDDRYVQPLHPVDFVPNHADWFVWQSRRDGWNHLYLYNTGGELLRQLTSGSWEVTDFKGFNPSGKEAYFLCTAVSPLCRDLFKVSIDGGNPVRLTSGKGMHRIELNDRCDYFIDRLSSMDVSLSVSVSGTKPGPGHELLKASDPLAEYALGRIQVFTIKNSAGDDLYCRMILPPSFDSSKTYPAIVYLYNGPNVQLINYGWQAGANLWFQYMAQRGFILFTVDGRGSAKRGKEFEQALFRHLGTVELEDQLEGVRFLKSLSYVDPQRLGIHGWSYGGFMTTGMVTRHPGIFKTAVAGGTVTDWRYYEVMYTERYMDTPAENPEGYETSSLLNYVDRLDCKLLMIHGTSDDVVVFQHSMLYLKKAIAAGKQVDYFAYPGYAHNVRGKDRIHLLNMISSYFINNL